MNDPADPSEAPTVATPTWRAGDELPARLECLACKLRELGQIQGADSVRCAESICEKINELVARLYALAGEQPKEE